jgi:pyruvate kinase
MDEKNYRIICTLGPASSSEHDWHGLLDAGANEFRLNTSHLSLREITGWLDRLRIFMTSRVKEVPVVLDLQGSKWRLGDFPAFELVPGQVVELVFVDAISGKGMLPVPHADFFTAGAGSDGEIRLNDAKSLLKILSSGSGQIKAEVIAGGMIQPKKGITFAHSSFRQETFSEKDREIVKETCELPFVGYALSYVKDSIEMKNFKNAMHQVQAENRNPEKYLIAKLERQPAVDQADEIARLVDEVWLCRGDLGAELGLREMAAAASRFTQTVGSISKPAILAGQVLEHMTAFPVPTRAEVCGLYDALAQGYQGIVLSDETAVGKNPVLACRSAAMFKT